MINESDVFIPNVSMNPFKTKILELLFSVGGKIEYQNKRNESGEQICDLYVKHSNLTAVTIYESDFTLDDYPLLFLIAFYASGKTIIEKKKHNSKMFNLKIQNVINGLRSCGASIKVEEDKVIINGSDNYIVGGVQVDGVDDFYISLAFIICGFISKERISIKNCVPGLFNIFNNHNIEKTYA
jgi:3-phosphoshikimate 1-carboxyvinyltransferase